MAADFPLGWVPPADRSHEDRYLLTSQMPAGNCPVVIGIKWYSGFDRPKRDSSGVYWIGGDSTWGQIRGGHCVCLRPPTVPDLVGAHYYWNQRTEGACVGFGVSRAASLYNRRLYDGFGLYRAAQKRDEWAGENYSGTSVNAGLNTLRLDGAWRVTERGSLPFSQDGCSSFLWARTSSDVLAALKSDEPFVRILNSWGLGYPAEVRITIKDFDRLIDDGAELGVPVDRIGRSKANRTSDG